jgi:hypothetical protein
LSSARAAGAAIASAAKRLTEATRAVIDFDMVNII